MFLDENPKEWRGSMRGCVVWNGKGGGGWIGKLQLAPNQTLFHSLASLMSIGAKSHVQLILRSLFFGKVQSPSWEYALFISKIDHTRDNKASPFDYVILASIFSSLFENHIEQTKIKTKDNFFLSYLNNTKLLVVCHGWLVANKRNISNRVLKPTLVLSSFQYPLSINPRPRDLIKK